jgi:hypothetical protein
MKRDRNDWVPRFSVGDRVLCHALMRGNRREDDTENVWVPVTVSKLWITPPDDNGILHVYLCGGGCHHCWNILRFTHRGYLLSSVVDTIAPTHFTHTKTGRFTYRRYLLSSVVDTIAPTHFTHTKTGRFTHRRLPPSIKTCGSDHSFLIRTYTHTAVALLNTQFR